MQFSDTISGKIKLFHLNNTVGSNQRVGGGGNYNKQHSVNHTGGIKCNIYSAPPFINPVNSCNQLSSANNSPTFVPTVDHLTDSHPSMSNHSNSMDNNGQSLLYKKQIQFEEGPNGQQSDSAIYSDPSMFERSRSLRSVTIQGPFHSKFNQ